MFEENGTWQALPNVTGVEVSTLGKVRTLDRLVSSESRTRFTKERILKQYDNAHGYLNVRIPIDGKWTTKLVHRLVAQTFIPNPDNLSEVNHKNCDRYDNRVSNLEWCSHSYNQKYRDKFGVSQAEALGLPLFAINLTTLEVSQFRSQREASRALGVDYSTIGKVVKGKLKQTGGYWFTEDNGNGVEADKDKLRKIKADMNFKGGVFAINLKTQEALRFESQSKASRKLEVNLGNINSVIKDRLSQTKGYWFTNADNKAVETTRDKLGDIVASKVEKLMKRKTSNIK